MSDYQNYAKGSPLEVKRSTVLVDRLRAAPL
jgi:hypothetical protein